MSSCFGGVMVSVVALSVVDREFKHASLECGRS